MSSVYVLKKDDIAMAAGGPMGSPVETIWQRFHLTMEGAKQAAQKDSKEKLVWTKGRRYCASQDLGSHQYTVTQEKLYP